MMIEKRAVAIIVLNIVIPALGCNGYPGGYYHHDHHHHGSHHGGYGHGYGHDYHYHHIGKRQASDDTIIQEDVESPFGDYEYDPQDDLDYQDFGAYDLFLGRGRNNIDPRVNFPQYEAESVTGHTLTKRHLIHDDDHIHHEGHDHSNFTGEDSHDHDHSNHDHEMESNHNITEQGSEHDINDGHDHSDHDNKNEELHSDGKHDHDHSEVDNNVADEPTSDTRSNYFRFNWKRSVDNEGWEGDNDYELEDNEPHRNHDRNGDDLPFPYFNQQRSEDKDGWEKENEYVLPKHENDVDHYNEAAELYDLNEVNSYRSVYFKSDWKRAGNEKVANEQDNDNHHDNTYQPVNRNKRSEDENGWEVLPEYEILDYDHDFDHEVLDRKAVKNGNLKHKREVDKDGWERDYDYEIRNHENDPEFEGTSSHTAFIKTDWKKRSADTTEHDYKLHRDVSEFLLNEGRSAFGEDDNRSARKSAIIANQRPKRQIEAGAKKKMKRSTSRLSKREASPVYGFAYPGIFLGRGVARHFLGGFSYEQRSPQGLFRYE